MSDRTSGESTCLSRVPKESAEAYQAQMGFLVEQVNNAMLARDDLSLLIGGNDLGLMIGNHRNHAAFMVNVFFIKQIEMIEAIVPWVYAAYRNQGFSIDYFPVHLNAWRQVLEKNLPSELAQPLVDVYLWLLSKHEDFLAQADSSPYVSYVIDPKWHDVINELVSNLLAADVDSSLELCKDHVQCSEDMLNFSLKVIQPALYRIGEMWENGEISTAKEHLATALVNRILGMLYVKYIGDSKTTKQKVIVSAAANEFHEIGAQMVANSLEMNGWDVMYLGSNTPIDALIDILQEHRPFILALSVTMPYNFKSVSDLISRMRSVFSDACPKIMLGGLAFSRLSDLPVVLGADGYAKDSLSALDLAERWRVESMA